MADDSKFVLRWEINNATATLADNKAESEVFSAGGFEWMAGIYSSPSDETKIAYILECDHPLSRDWRCELEIEHVLHSAKSNRTYHKQLFSMNNDVNKFHINSALQWTELFNIDNGYLNDDKIIVEFRINIMTSEVIPILIDPTKFCSPNEMGNVTIVMGENKVQVSKEVHTIAISLIVPVNNITSLEMTERTVGHIVKLADRFHIEHALNLSKKFLMQSKDIEDVSKLMFADQYKFDSIRDHCIESYSDFAEVLKLMSRPEWKEFSAETKAAINERLAMLMTNAGHIKLKVIGQDSREFHFRMKYGDSLGKLKKSYANRIGVSVDSIRFLFEGRRTNDDDTPESLELEYDDYIEMLRVAGESPVKKKYNVIMAEGRNEVPIELEKAKELLEREKRERLELMKDFKEFLLLPNNDMMKKACKMRYTDDPFAVLTEEMATDRRERRDDSEVSLSTLSLSNESNSEVGRDEDFLPFLALPDELISHTFSFLSMKDRLQARVNKRLDEIELKSKYHVDKLLIHEVSEHDFKECSWISNTVNHICFIEDVSYSSDCIKRLTQNVSIGCLDVHLNGSPPFYSEIYNLVKDFDIGRLVFRPNSRLDSGWNPIMDDSFFIDLTRACEELIMWDSVNNVSPEAFHQVYKAMIAESTKLRLMRVNTSFRKCTSFLALIGITYNNEDERFFSDRNIESIRSIDYEINTVYLFDGNLEISLHFELFAYNSGYLSFELHESEESLENAKNREGYRKVDISPQ